MGLKEAYGWPRRSYEEQADCGGTRLEHGSEAAAVERESARRERRAKIIMVCQYEYSCRYRL
jgi:hypothetical protein